MAKNGKKKGEESASLGAIRSSYKKAAKELEKVLRGKEALYRIPWFAMVGEPDSGKEFLLPESGLSARPGCPNTYGVEGQHANKWWFFSNAVVIDYAGVYFTGSDEKLDDEDDKPGFFGRLFGGGKKDFAEGAWKANLKLGLREVRRRRPIDGMIIAVDARGLLERGPDAITRIQRRAETVAERIHEAQHTLGVHFPTYVVLTHCEAIPGFEVFAQAMPEVMRDQMFGWSSPYDTDTSYQPSWVDEAINSVHEAVSVTQLDLLPHVGRQTDRDGLYLLPKHLGALRAALKAYLDPIFKATSYRQALPLRGIYMTAQVSDDPNAATPEPEAPEDLMAALMAANAGAPAPSGGGTPPKPAFVRQLLTEKVFREAGLTKLDDEQKRKLKKKVRWYRIAVAVVCLIGLTLILIQRSMTASRIEKFAKVRELLQYYQQRASVNQPIEDSKGLETLSALAELDVNGFEIATAPTSYFDDLTEATNGAIARLLSVGVAKPLRTALEEKANALLPEALESMDDNPVLAGGSPAVAGARRRTRSSADTMREGIGGLSKFAKEVDDLRANFMFYNKHDVQSLAALFQFVTGKDFSEQLSKNDRLYNAIGENIWDELKFDRFSKRAKVKQKRMAMEFRDELFDKNLLSASLGSLTELLDAPLDTGESYAERLVAINEGIGKVESHIDGGNARWLLPEEFKPGTAYTKLIELFDGDSFPKADSMDESQAMGLGEAFQKENQRLFGELRNKVWGASSRAGKFRLLGQHDGKVVLSDELETVKQHVNRYMGQPYVLKGDQTQYQLGVARQAGLRDGWNETLLREILDWRTKHKAYIETTHDELKPAALSTALHQAATRELRARINLAMEYARPKDTLTAEDAAASWTPQRKDELKNRIRNLKAEHARILQVIEALKDVNHILSEPQDRELADALRDDIIKLLTQVDSILTSEKLYQINQQDFSWWQGDQPPNVVAFGARDSNDLVARLEVQRTTIQTLANDFARPLDEVITAAGDAIALTNAGLVNKWKEILGVLDEYDKKVPGNSLEKIERFIETDLGDLKLETCREQLKAITSDRSGKNYFEARMYRIATQMQTRCDRILKKVTVEGYLELQQYFESRLLGKFPFSGPDVLAEVETGEIVEFYKLYDKYAPAFEALIKPKSGRVALFDNATGEVQRFLAQVEKARRLFKDMLNAEDENPDLVLDTQLEFRVNRDNELGGNQIIDWYASVADSQVNFRSNKRSTQWRTNDPLGMCFRWARDADFIPAANQRNEQLRVNGREACFVYAGRWALLRMLVAHATTPADRGRRSFLRPHTLRFEIETSLASSRGGAGAIAQDARLYTRIGILLPGEKSASKLPEFPRRAPEIPKRVLQKHQIMADKKGGR